MGELLTAIEWSTDATPVVLKRYEYAYDALGNRTTEQDDNTVLLSTYDALNRLVSQQPGGAIRVAGTLSEPAAVTIQGKPATTTADGRFEGSVPVSAGMNTFSVNAVNASGNSRTQTYQFDLGGTSHSFTYDANGNLLSDSTRTFEWDAADRLTAMVTGTQRDEFTYDAGGRRTRIVQRDNGSVTSDRQFV